MILSTIPDRKVENHKHAFTIKILGDRDRNELPFVTIESVTQGQNGTVTINENGSLTYTPVNAGKEDSFKVILRDAEGETVTKTVRVEALRSDREGDSEEKDGDRS